MTETTPGLTAMKLPELKKLAGELGITGASTMRKGDLVGAISSKQGGSSAPATRSTRPARSHDAAVQRRLWSVSEELTGVVYPVGPKR